MIVPRMVHDCFLPNPFQYIIHQPSYHSKLYSATYWKRSKITNRHRFRGPYCLHHQGRRVSHASNQQGTGRKESKFNVATLKFKRVTCLSLNDKVSSNLLNLYVIVRKWRQWPGTQETADLFRRGVLGTILGCYYMTLSVCIGLIFSVKW
jgi:hypothetical protein